MKVLEYTLSGWTESWNADEELYPYYNRKDELSVDDGCLLWGRRVVIPGLLQSQLLDQLHECHPGMCQDESISKKLCLVARYRSRH